MHVYLSFLQNKNIHRDFLNAHSSIQIAKQLFKRNVSFLSDSVLYLWPYV